MNKLMGKSSTGTKCSIANDYGRNKSSRDLNSFQNYIFQFRKLVMIR
jgi:hypothetical protein